MNEDQQYSENATLQELCEDMLTVKQEVRNNARSIDKLRLQIILLEAVEKTLSSSEQDSDSTGQPPSSSSPQEEPGVEPHRTMELDLHEDPA